jgi:colicin import membrane protein
MKQYLSIGTEPSLQKIIIASAIFHLIFITLATIPIKTKDREYKSYFVNIVGPSEVRSTAQKRRGKKTVPQKTVTKEKGAVKMKAPPRKRVAPKKGVSLEPEKKAKQVSKEIERLRAIKALSAKRARKSEETAKAGEADADIEQAIEVIRKKKLGSSSAQAGIPGSQSSVNADSYYALVTQQIWSEWIYPDFDATGLEVVISIKIDKQGRVISQKIEQSSGNTLFDRSAAKAISKASPLPPPAVEMEIGVRFYL